MYWRLFITFLLGILFLTACVTQVGRPSTPVEATQNVATMETRPVTEAPVTRGPIMTPLQEVTAIPEGYTNKKEDWQPQPGDEKLQRGEVIIEESGILTLESFPPQFVLHVSGTKGDPCRVVRATVSKPDAQNQIEVDVYSLTDPAMMCIQVVKGFELNIPLGSLPRGMYTLWLNGNTVGEVVAAEG